MTFQELIGLNLFKEYQDLFVVGELYGSFWPNCDNQRPNKKQ